MVVFQFSLCLNHCRVYPDFAALEDWNDCCFSDFLIIIAYSVIFFSILHSIIQVLFTFSFFTGVWLTKIIFSAVPAAPFLLLAFFLLLPWLLLCHHCQKGRDLSSFSFPFSIILFHRHQKNQILLHFHLIRHHYHLHHYLFIYFYCQQQCALSFSLVM